MKDLYLADFSSREDMFNNFAQPDGGENIIFAHYEPGDYSGDAFVLYEQNGEYFEVHGAHCSCYGLEGQWEPEKVPLKALAMRVTKERTDRWYSNYYFDTLKQFLIEEGYIDAEGNLTDKE